MLVVWPEGGTQQKLNERSQYHGYLAGRARACTETFSRRDLSTALQATGPMT